MNCLYIFTFFFRCDQNEDLHQQKKYIVFESSLLILLANCDLCKGKTSCFRYLKGTLIKVHAVCTSCGLKKYWCNQPFVRNMSHELASQCSHSIYWQFAKQDLQNIQVNESILMAKNNDL